MSDLNFDPLAAFSSHRDDETTSAPAMPASQVLAEMVEHNPMSTVLVAAAAGAGLMALLSLMGRGGPLPTESAPTPPRPISLAPSRGFDLSALKQQIAELTERIASAAPSPGAAKKQLGDATDAIADGWGSLRQHALEAVAPLSRFEPQATAAMKAARENPVWTALVVGALGALLGSQLIGSSKDESADAPVA
jgi:hypothetical protein